jgi:hypothetical protein
MKKTYVYFIALSAALAGCTRATFSPIGDAGTGGPEVRTGDAGSCQLPDADVTCLPATTIHGMCDPVCQTGPCDWCHGGKCSIAGDDSTSICTSGGSDTLMAFCTVFSPTSHYQYDSCGRGYICLSNGVDVAQCFSLCGSSADCKGGNVACTQRPVASPSASLAYVCDPKYDSCDLSCCDPIIATGSNNGCPSSNQTCYLVTNGPNSQTNRTVCEYVSGGLIRGRQCTNSRDCIPTNACIEGFCHAVCVYPNGPCPGGLTCSPYGNQYGYCP